MTHFTVGRIFEMAGYPDRAEPAYRKTVELAPEQFEAHHYLGNCLLRLGRNLEAVAPLERTLDLHPGFAPALYSLGDALRGLLDIDGARSRYQAALAANPAFGKGGLRIKMAMLLPPVFGLEEIDGIRARLAADLEALEKTPPVLRDPLLEVGCANFFLAYHGRCDRDLNVATARMYEKACPGLLFQAPHISGSRRPGKLRIGFISQNFRNHSIGRSTQGLVAKLDPARFEKTAYFFHQPADGIGRFIRDHADHSVVLPVNLEAARRRIAQDQLDILYYQDIGMDPITYFLAFARLAPLQCVRPGHPDTTGIRNIDRFISCEGYESEGSEAHYSERLVMLRGVASPHFYYRPEIPETLKSKADFGFDSEARLYSCLQTLVKFHPDFDAVLAAILRGDPEGLVVLITAPELLVTQALERRFRHSMPDVADRVRFLPAMPHMDFMNLLALSDVVLDTLHFCGMNTSLQAFSVGSAVVTMPGPLQRSRHTSSMYRHMGIEACIAKDPQDYVRIALRLGLDPIFRSEVLASIRERSHRLYENPQVVREFERIFSEAFPDL
jgi:predicted O-linked N-acetylglucosamine transferase (SPINDLY family)